MTDTSKNRTPHPPLLKKLRVKFIALNMALAALVLAIAFVTICTIDWRNDTEEVYSELESAVSHAVNEPPFAQEKADRSSGTSAQTRASSREKTHGEVERTLGSSTEGTVPLSGASTQDTSTKDELDSQATTDAPSFATPQIGGIPHRQDQSMLPVAVYVLTDTTIYQLIAQSSAEVPSDILNEALDEAAGTNETRGFLPGIDLYFAKQQTEAGMVVAFADGSAANSWQSLAWGLAAVGIGALVLLFILNLLFSRWALKPVQNAWQQQNQFIADASHELKTPLTVILANNSILESKRDQTIESQMQWVESTKLEAERMQGLVADMLELARSDAEGEAAAQAEQSVENAHATVDFSHLVEGELLVFESVAFEKGIAWESSVESGLMVRGNERKLERLIGVLLDNACKYTPAGGEVSTRLESQDNSLVLRVQNTSEAIDAEDLAHLFDRFYRVDKARTHNAQNVSSNAGTAPDSTSESIEHASAPAEGYGLGLAIAQEITQAHKGKLTVESTEDEGTIFTLTLPVAK